MLDVSTLLAALGVLAAALALLEAAAALDDDAALALALALADALLDAAAELLDDEPPPQAAKPSIATRAALAASAMTFDFVFLILLPFGGFLPCGHFGLRNCGMSILLPNSKQNINILKLVNDEL